MYFGPADGDSPASMFGDLADLFEQAAADGTPIRAVGEDPVEFADACLRNYPRGQILSTLLKTDAGPASVNAFDVVTQAADVRESISLTGQYAAVDEILSGRENLALVARLRHLKDPGTIANDLL
jgi:hypothetical protein